MTITANSEKQGKVSFEEVYETIQRRGLEDHFYLTKCLLQVVRITRSFLIGRIIRRQWTLARDGSP